MRNGASRPRATAAAAAGVSDRRHFNRPYLLETLLRMAREDSLSSLRALIDRARADLANPRGPLYRRRNGPDAVALRPEFLGMEFDQIAASRTVERARYYVQRLIKGLTEFRTPVNSDINLNRWKDYPDILTDSLWVMDKRDRSGVHSAEYWGNFIPQIPNQMMRRYTKPGEWVLDGFAGSGTTLIEARRLGRHCLGIELQKSVAAATRRRLNREPNPDGVVATVHTGDSASFDPRRVLRRHGVDRVQLVMLHPPYFDIIRFSDDPRDLSNAPSVGEFLDGFGGVVENTGAVLDRGRCLVVVIGDTYQDGEWIPLGFLAMEEVRKRGFRLKSIVVKNFEETSGKRGTRELWRYRALAGGFYIFKHEYILIFTKL